MPTETGPNPDKVVTPTPTPTPTKPVGDVKQAAAVLIKAVQLPSAKSLVEMITAKRLEAEQQAGSPHFNPFQWYKVMLKKEFDLLKAGLEPTEDMVYKITHITVPSPAENKAHHKKMLEEFHPDMPQ